MVTTTKTQKPNNCQTSLAQNQKTCETQLKQLSNKEHDQTSLAQGAHGQTSLNIFVLCFLLLLIVFFILSKTNLKIIVFFVFYHVFVFVCSRHLWYWLGFR